MDGADQQQPDRLEDQLRRMIIANGTSPTSADDIHRQFPPTVRLPPRGSYQSPQTTYNATPSRQSRSPQSWGTQSPGFTQDSSSTSPIQPAPHFPPQRGRQQRGRGQRGNSFGHQGFQRGHYHPPNPHRQTFSLGEPAPNQRARMQQQIPLDPNAFYRGQHDYQPHARPRGGPQQLFNPHAPQQPFRGPVQTAHADQHIRQSQHLDQLAANEIRNVEMSATERNSKEAFRLSLEQICQEVTLSSHSRLPRVSLECFGSFQSGFATAGSDMDLAIVVKDPHHTPADGACFSLLEDDLPRLLEKRLLQLGYGARLLSRTRVPIIKVCEKPDASLLDKLRQERERWDGLENELKYPHLHQEGEEVVEEGEMAGDAGPSVADVAEVASEECTTDLKGEQRQKVVTDTHVNGTRSTNDSHANDSTPKPAKSNNAPSSTNPNPSATSPTKPAPPTEKPWTRERKAGPLDFPKTGIGIQSDINFFNPLGLHNTQLLRCYSLCDARVRPMILFIKAWAKKRKINSAYSGTLSSYGYVLMVLHYLVNVARPAVLPNLQSSWRPFGCNVGESEGDVVDGWPVNFWRNEAEIQQAASQGKLTSNREPLGSLLAGFFHYYASQGGPGPTFKWMQEVLSLRSTSSLGLLSKEEKGWVKAVLENGEGGKKIQHRYLFCIEDPFELGHNVARTVTHRGIVAIRDEFRRAKRILQDLGVGAVARDGELCAQLIEVEDLKPGDVFKADGMEFVVAEGAGEDVHNTGLGPAGQFQRGDLTTPTIPDAGGAANPQAAKPYGPSNRGNRRGGANTPNSSQAKPANNKTPPQTQTVKPPDAGDEMAFPSLRNTVSPRHRTDETAFPSLRSTTSSTHQRKQSKSKSKPSEPRGAASALDTGALGSWSEISGDQAKAVLEEVKRKRDEAQAESTAMGAAEAVLGDMSD